MPEFNPNIRLDKIALWVVYPGVAFAVRILRAEHTLKPSGWKTMTDISFMGKRLKGIPASQLYLP